MDLFQIVLFASLIIGILMVVISMLILNGEKKGYAKDERSTAKFLEESNAELDKNIEEFENLSKTVFEELDQKYQEVLFLYNLLDEKRREIAEFYVENKKPSTNVIANQPKKYINPKAKEIMELKNQGFGVSEIAKKLDIGKAEVKLILELSKDDG